ncbi:uncharacterized protein LOC111628595 isoform X2 [Centruroides sculpturatus]|uniref:uncharacterized protein LOC111628595 isoform X2 n=1 Tax=Centruroides sculpturatus TaxID=218467 RepID=UPI000C6E37AE|nr:uncharacterized protein LOC111628595 isoform X2 [Centruroides sculpturatus]
MVKNLTYKESKEISYFVGSYTLMYSVIRLATGNYKTFAGDYINQNKIDSLCYNLYKIISWIAWSGLLLVSFVLLIAIRKKPRLMLPWLMWMPIVTIGVPASEICLLVAIVKTSMLIILMMLTFILTCMNIYCLLYVYYYYKSYKHKKQPRRLEVSSNKHREEENLEDDKEEIALEENLKDDKQVTKDNEYLYSSENLEISDEDLDTTSNHEGNLK